MAEQNVVVTGVCSVVWGQMVADVDRWLIYVTWPQTRLVEKFQMTVLGRHYLYLQTNRRTDEQMNRRTDK